VFDPIVQLNIQPTDRVGVIGVGGLGQSKSISASPLGGPAMTAKMLEFAARHGIKPIPETYNFDQVNEAIDRLRNGKPRYRIVLKR